MPRKPWIAELYGQYAGRAAVDEATRNILSRISGSGYTLAGCHPARKLYQDNEKMNNAYGNPDSEEICIIRNNLKQSVKA